MTIVLNDGRMRLCTTSGIGPGLAQRVGFLLAMASTAAAAGTDYDAARSRKLCTSACARH